MLLHALIVFWHLHLVTNISYLEKMMDMNSTSQGTRSRSGCVLHLYTSYENRNGQVLNDKNDETNDDAVLSLVALMVSRCISGTEGTVNLKACWRMAGGLWAEL